MHNDVPFDHKNVKYAKKYIYPESLAVWRFDMKMKPQRQGEF